MTENKSSVSYVDVISHRNECKRRISFLGDSGTGKTSIIERYTENTFQNYIMTTIGVDFKSKSFLRNGTLVKLQVYLLSLLYC